jgi:hypothetical protein
VQASYLMNKKEFSVEKGNILKILKQTLKNAVPTHDRRTTLPHLEFVCGVIFCFIGDTKTSSIESIRRFMIYTFDVRLSKGAFWERLSRVKTNAVIRINQVVKGIGRQLVGAKLCSDHLKKRRRSIVEFIGEIGSAESSKCYRVIGFWNAADKQYRLNA